MSFHRLHDLSRWAAARLSAERGQTMAEYGILIAVIAIVVVVAATLLGSNISHVFSTSGARV